MPQKFLMARQPIFNRDRELVAYELLYRSPKVAPSGVLSEEDEASALANALVEIGLDRLVGEKQAFVNVPSSLLFSEAIRLLPPKRVVLEILETLTFTPQVEKRIYDLRTRGYKVAYDDFVFESYQRAFLDSVSLVKVDVLGVDFKELGNGIRELKGRGLKVLAEKVEDEKMYKKCLHLGCDFFQGYFFAKPEVLSSTGLSQRRQVVLTVLSKLNDPIATLTQIEEVISADAGLVVRLLVLVNSAALGIAKKVDSVRGALSILGLSQVQALASLLLMAAESTATPELMNLGLCRARMSDHVASSWGLRDPQSHFTAGLFTILEALLQAPIATIVAPLPLCDEIKIGLTEPDGDTDIARVQRFVRQFESADFSDASPEDGDAYLESLAWAERLQRQCA